MTKWNIHYVKTSPRCYIRGFSLLTLYDRRHQWCSTSEQFYTHCYSERRSGTRFVCYEQWIPLFRHSCRCMFCLQYIHNISDLLYSMLSWKKQQRRYLSLYENQSYTGYKRCLSSIAVAIVHAYDFWPSSRMKFMPMIQRQLNMTF